MSMNTLTVTDTLTDRRGTYRSAVATGAAWRDCALCGHRTPRADMCLACAPVADLPTHEHRCTIGRTA